MAALHFVGHKIGKTLLLPQQNGIKLVENATETQENFVQRMSRQGDVDACAAEGKYTCLHRWDHLK